MRIARDAAERAASTGPLHEFRKGIARGLCFPATRTRQNRKAADAGSRSTKKSTCGKLEQRREMGPHMQLSQTAQLRWNQLTQMQQLK
jgi:hypothetical protein